jgi:hypothetical protein
VQYWLIDLCVVGNIQLEVNQCAAIDRLPDEVLETIFRFDSPTPIYSDRNSFPPLHRREPWDWHRLVHVCRRWRYIIFNAPRSLELRLFCTYGTHVTGNGKKNLDCWPALPIVLQYAYGPLTLPVDEDNVIAALEHPDRICAMDLTVTTSLLEKLTILAQKRFPVLEYLGLEGEPENKPILLNKFLIGPCPSLRILQVYRVAFPALQQILPLAKDLVHLRLQELPYLTPAALRNLFPGLTRLKELFLYFHSPISRPISESGRDNPPPCRSVLPALECVGFCGTSEDLECLLSSTEAPVLQDITITFFNQATTFDTSQFVQFLSHTKTQRSHDFAQLYFSESDTYVAFYEQEWHRMTLRVRCMSLDWQLSCMAEICANLLPIISDVRHLHIDASFHFPSEHDDMDSLPLLELLRPFRNVMRLDLADTVALYVKSALKKEVTMGVLPDVHEIKVTMRPEEDKNEEKCSSSVACHFQELKCAYRGGALAVALPAKSLDKSRCCLRLSSRGNNNVVLPRQCLRRMEVESFKFSLVDIWQACVVLSFESCTS